MSSMGIVSNLFSSDREDTSQFPRTRTGFTDTSTNNDFSSSLAVRVATLQAQSISLLIGSTRGDGTKGSNLDFLSNLNDTTSGSAKTKDLFSNGRNISLFDPESAYRMMTNINTKDITYKAQYSELSEMQQGIAAMQQAGQSLGSITGSTENDVIKGQLQAFADKYNAWIGRFGSTVRSGGLLAGTQAAEISLYELKQSIENPFNGAKNGVHGLGDLGFTIDPVTNLVSINTGTLDASLATKHSGAIDTIQEFSANFTKSAELLNSTNNFVLNRLENLGRVIDYISENKRSLQAEFGTGDPAKPTTQVAKALANYTQIFSR